MPARRCAKPTAATARRTTSPGTTATKIVPLRKTIADENLLRYNGMLIGVFELLADAREQIRQRRAGDRRAARLLARRCCLAGGADRQARRAWPRWTQRPARLQATREALIERRATNPLENRHDAESTSLSTRRRERRRRGGCRLGQQGRDGRAARAGDPDQAGHDAAAGAEHRPALQPGRHAQRLDLALAHERRRQGVPPRRRAGGARDGARLQGAPVGLQRPVARADDRGRRRRPRAHLRHQQAARAHRRSTGTASGCRTAWTA